MIDSRVLAKVKVSTEQLAVTKHIPEHVQALERWGGVYSIHLMAYTGVEPQLQLCLIDSFLS